MTNRNKSNFESHEVVSPKNSGIRVVRLKLSVAAKGNLASKSPGIRSSTSSSQDKSKAEKEIEDDRLMPC